MSYNAKHIFSINDKSLSTPDNLKRLADLFKEMTNDKYDLAIFEDHLDDSNWNDGDGISEICIDDYFCKMLSEKFGDIAFTVHIISEEDDVYEYKCKNGEVEDIDLGNLFEWFLENRKEGDYIGSEDDDDDAEYDAFLEENVETYPFKYGNTLNLAAAARYYYK